MANPYLVQALYGPKPVAPGAENVKPAAANNAPAPQPSSRRDSAADVKPNIAQGASAPASRPSNPFGGRVGGVQFGNFSDAAVTASPPSNPFGRTPADGGKTVTFGSPPPPGPTPSLVPKSILKPTAPASSPAPGPPPFVKLEPSVQSTAFSNTTTLWLGKNSSGVNPASLSGAPASQPLSLLERLYGTQATVKKEQEYYIHNVRRNSDGAQDKSDDAEEETEPWRPTGANMLTLGAAAAGSNSPSLASAPMQEPSFSKPAATFMAEPKLENGLSPTSMQAINGLQPSTLRSELTLAPERYLPPPGPFYDQFMLAQIFTIQFSHCTCWVCWNAVAKCERRLLCEKKCKVCDRQHLGTTCPMLYCTISWFVDNKVDYVALKREGRQFRPSQTELEVLLRMQLVLDVPRHGAPIRPNMAHPLVQKFYRDKAVPQMLEKKLPKPLTAKQRADAYEEILRKEAQASAPAMTGFGVNASLDPRLQGNAACSNTPSMSRATPFSILHRPAEETVNADAGLSNQNTSHGFEDKLQELEDENLKLRNENVLKDREIRKLKAENEQLRGMGYEKGSKRPRV